MKVLGAVGTGIGILGLVTFFGGAILWVRAYEAELPATEAVSVVPNSVLVTTGASFLVPAVLIALLAVALIFGVHLVFHLLRERKVRDDRDDAKELGQEAEAMARDAEAKLQSAQAARMLTTTLEEAEARAEQNPESAASLDELKQQADAQRLEAERLEAEALTAMSAAATKKAEADNKGATAEIAVERTRRQFEVELGFGIFALAVLPPWANGAIFHVSLVFDGLLLVGVAALAAAISLFVYAVTEYKFVWFGVVAFVTVGIYIGCATYLSTKGNPKMQPVAALRTGHSPVTGAFIADTSSNLYVGTFREPGEPPRMLVIPRTQVTELAIGPLLDPDAARARAVSLALEECEQQVEEPRTEKEPATIKPACSESQKAALSSLAGAR